MRKAIKRDLMVVFLTILLVTVLQDKVFCIAVVRGHSMENTFQDGDLLVIRKDWLVKPENIKKDDIVVVQLQNSDMKVVKRVVGVAGDDIDIRDGSVYLNGSMLDESYVQGVTHRYSYTVVGQVPASCFYVLGDNREHSSDSREYGFVDADNIFGVWSGIRINLSSFIRKIIG